ncbi:MAG: SMI1/KNR4 family protein [Bacteroidia bacterium]
MSTTPTLQRIKSKLSDLKKLDGEYALFGAHKHKYVLNPPCTEKQVSDFELKNKIKLPEGYRDFLLVIGNGGSGPYYGLEPLENGLFADLDYKSPDRLNDLSKEFPFTDKWNMNFRGLGEAEYSKKKKEEYYKAEFSNGLLRICNYGCGVSINLVVNGSEYGNIWTDDRCNDQGIYPDTLFGNVQRLDFLTWYELWLDESLILS